MGRRAALLLALLAVGGCRRQAPSARDCERFALQVVGVSDARALAHPRVKTDVDAWTTRCLTTPYDRELLACVERGSRGCYQAFASRHPDRAERDGRRLPE